jgi:hypothetical protein
MKFKYPFVSRLFLALAISGVIFIPASFASLALYDTAIADAHGGGAGTLPYAAALDTPEVFDGSNAADFNFGSLTGPATIELIIEGDPVAGGQNGYIGAGTNGGNSLRFEQWNDTGTLGFTRSGVADYDLAVPSPTEPTHIAYRWDGVDTMALFVDGTLSGTVAGATFEMPSGAGLIGNVSDGGTQGMIGTIHRITTYDSLVDDATILQHAEAWLATGDPSIGVPANVNLELNGPAQSFGLAVKNLGESNMLTITAVTVDGVNADYFTIDTALPLNLDPGGEAELDYTVDPGGANGEVEATFTVSSNDALNPEAEVQISGLVRDPQISVQTSLDLGVSDVEVTQMIEVKNLGGTRALTLGTLEITGTDAAKFSAVGPASIAAGGSGNIEVTFSPEGSAGGFTAQLEIGSDDPGSPVTIVTLSAITPIAEGFLSVYDSVIAADHGDGTGLIPHQALLSVPSAFDSTNSSPFDFGIVSGDATFEFVLQGDPDLGGRDGFLAVAENSTFSLRYEQWDDTGALGFTQAGVEDYVFKDEGDAALLNSPTGPTHVAYRWQSDLQTMSLYIDGELAGTHLGSNFEMPTGLGVLGNNAGGTEGMLGTIHRVTIYDNDIGGDNIIRHANAFVTGAGASEFKITSIDLNQETGLVTIVWNSIPGAVYAVDTSFELLEWNELDDSVTADDTTKSFSTTSSLPVGETKIFFRVRRP